MGDWIEEFVLYTEGIPWIVKYLVVGGAAFLEYVFPPVPGDLVVLLGAVLVGKEGWSLHAVAVVASVNIGAVVGMTVDYIFGRWVHSRDAAWRKRYRRWRKMGIAVDRVDASFRRWGAVYIVLNRFLPGIRAAFFVAAGMSRLPYWKVFLWGLVSAAVWNALIFAAGMTVGHNLEKLKEIFDTYSTVAWIVVGCVVLFVGYRLVKAVRSARDETA